VIIHCKALDFRASGIDSGIKLIHFKNERVFFAKNEE
jgi:hypothetical protein